MLYSLSIYVCVCMCIYIYTYIYIYMYIYAAAKSLQSCPALCNPIDRSPPGSPVPGILQAITLEWVAISFSNAWKWKVKVKSLSRVWPSVTPWTAAFQAPPSMEFSRQEYWSGVPLYIYISHTITPYDNNNKYYYLLLIIGLFRYGSFLDYRNRKETVRSRWARVETSVASNT